MPGTDLNDMLDAANAPLKDPEMNRSIGTGTPRFELYHFALSVCSQKVRTCLAEKAAPYISHDINLSLPDLGNYDPAYVRLRSRGSDGAALVSGYTGRSSISTEGFDPAVVPTLVDLVQMCVVTDSANICTHINRTLKSGPDLRPTALATMIDAEIAIVDQTPHVAVLYGAHPDCDFRPERLRKSMPGVHDRKIEKLKMAQALVAEDATLTRAFNAKIQKEESARTFVATPDMMRGAVSDILDIIADLDARLSDGRTGITGADFTLADVMWAVSLFRLKWLGMAFAWEAGHALNRTARPSVSAYATRLFDRPSFREAVIDWPGIPTTEFVTEYNQQ